MLLLGLFVAPIIVHVKILTGRAQRFMSQVVSDQAKVDLLIGHMRTGGVSEPMGRGTFE